MSATETTDIKEVVKEKYGEAALRVKTGGSSCCGATAGQRVAAIPSRPTCTTPPKPDRSPKKRCWPRSDAAIPRRWPS